jgi:hypothetical protein
VRFCTNAGTDQRASPAAAQLIGDYFMPMAERVYGDVAASDRARAAAAVARWVFTKRPAELHTRRLQREAAARIAYGRADPRSCRVLVEADWLREPSPDTAFGQRGRIAYAVNPQLWEAAE